MADRSQDLKAHREAFLNQLTQSKPDLSHHQDYLHYWKTVEKEAPEAEDLQQLNDWLRDLAQDKDKIKEMKQRTSMMDREGGDSAIQAINHIIKMVLEMLDAIERRLTKIRNEKRATMAAVAWKGGPGTRLKKKDDKDKKEDKKKGPVTGKPALDASAPVKKAPPPAKKRAREKKMER